jgi:hypothetical protein
MEWDRCIFHGKKTWLSKEMSATDQQDAQPVEDPHDKVTKGYQGIRFLSGS